MNLPRLDRIDDRCQSPVRCYDMAYYIIMPSSPQTCLISVGTETLKIIKDRRPFVLTFSLQVLDSRIDTLGVFDLFHTKTWIESFKTVLHSHCLHFLTSRTKLFSATTDCFHYVES